jgi:indole-3-glycerol phosphate synthase
MHAILEKILAEKREEVQRLKEGGITSPREKSRLPIRDFKGAISAPDRINLIAEIKFASPSAGKIREETDPIAIGKMYEAAGAAAISLLTDRRFFGGDLHALPALKKSVSLPILRKDFILDAVQIRESALYGADAVLLIAGILALPDLKALLGICRDTGLSAVTEVHDQDDVEKALQAGADIIGINNRDLKTFDVNRGTTVELARLIPSGPVLVSESGIRDDGDIRFLKKSGTHAVLVGTSIMKSRDPLRKARELVQAGAG